MEIVLLLFQFLIALGIAFLFYAVQQVPKTLNDLIVEKVKSENKNLLQTKAYFQSISNHDVNSILKKWTEILAKPEEVSKMKPVELIKLQTDTIMYGSEKTVKLLALFMQVNYNQNENDTKKAFLLLVYICYIVASLKRDFTSYRIEPLDLLDIRIKDLNNEQRENLKEYEKIIREKIDW